MAVAGRVELKARPAKRAESRQHLLANCIALSSPCAERRLLLAPLLLLPARSRCGGPRIERGELAPLVFPLAERERNPRPLAGTQFERPIACRRRQNDAKSSRAEPSRRMASSTSERGSRLNGADWPPPPLLEWISARSNQTHARAGRRAVCLLKSELTPAGRPMALCAPLMTRRLLRRSLRRKEAKGKARPRKCDEATARRLDKY